MRDDGDRLPGGLLRRVAERFLSRRTIDGVVIPALADLQHESAAARAQPIGRRAAILVRGYLAFWTAMAVCLASWPARSLRNEWLAPAAAGPRLLKALAPRAALLGVTLTLVMATSSLRWARHSGDWWVVPMFLPAIVPVMVPIAFFLGLILALGRLGKAQPPIAPRRWLGPALALSIVTGLSTFGFFGWITPAVNQTYRERVFRWVVTNPTPESSGAGDATRAVPVLPKGTRELTLTQLRTQIHDEHRRGRSTAGLEVEWHKKWAIPVASVLAGPLAIGLLGLSQRPRTALSLALAIGTIFLLYAAGRVGEQWALAGIAQPLPAIWAGDAALAVATLWLLARMPRNDEGEMTILGADGGR